MPQCTLLFKNIAFIFVCYIIITILPVYVYNYTNVTVYRFRHIRRASTRKQTKSVLISFFILLSFNWMVELCEVKLVVVGISCVVHVRCRKLADVAKICLDW